MECYTPGHVRLALEKGEVCVDQAKDQSLGEISLVGEM